MIFKKTAFLARSLLTHRFCTAVEKSSRFYSASHEWVVFDSKAKVSYCFDTLFVRLLKSGLRNLQANF